MVRRRWVAGPKARRSAWILRESEVIENAVMCCGRRLEGVLGNE